MHFIFIWISNLYFNREVDTKTGDVQVLILPSLVYSENLIVNIFFYSKWTQI